MKLRTKLFFIGFLFLTLSLFAQGNHFNPRKGLVFGASAGVAKSFLHYPTKSEKFTDVGIDLKFGYMLHEHLAILVTSNVAIYDYSGFGRERKRDFGVVVPAVQYWFGSRVWFLGGIGVGGDHPVFWDIKNPNNDPQETKYFSGFGSVASVGYELFRSKNHFSLDIKTRIMYRNVNVAEGKTTGLSYGILIGFNFY